ncbi:MAG TPA: PLDc N-terminal domain-containing protein [Longimicrobium sp.]
MSFGLGFVEMIVVFGVFSVLFLLWPWALYECLVHESSEGNTKIAWALVILLAPVVGALLSIVVRRPRRRYELGR